MPDAPRRSSAETADQRYQEALARFNGGGYIGLREGPGPSWCMAKQNEDDLVRLLASVVGHNEAELLIDWLVAQFGSVESAIAIVIAQMDTLCPLPEAVRERLRISLAFRRADQHIQNIENNILKNNRNLQIYVSYTFRYATNGIYCLFFDSACALSTKVFLGSLSNFSCTDIQRDLIRIACEAQPSQIILVQVSKNAFARLDKRNRQIIDELIGLIRALGIEIYKCLIVGANNSMHFIRF
jgi:hypothetical protein